MTKDEKNNGGLPVSCLLGVRQWSDMLADAKEKIDELHGGMTDMMEALQPLKDLALSAKNIEDNLIGPATGLDRIPIKTVEVIFAESAKSNRTVIRIFAGICIALITVIGFLLIGHHFKWVDFLG